MSQPPPRSQDAKEEAESLSILNNETTIGPFRSLLGKLLKVKPEEVKAAERAFAARKST